MHQVFVLKEPICNYGKSPAQTQWTEWNASNCHRTEKKYWERHGTNDTCYNFQRTVPFACIALSNVVDFLEGLKIGAHFLLVDEHSKHLTYSFTFLLVASNGRNASNGRF